MELSHDQRQRNQPEPGGGPIDTPADLCGGKPEGDNG
jgi:hypothetical protein